MDRLTTDNGIAGQSQAVVSATIHSERLRYFFGALVPLTDIESWEQIGTETPEGMAEYWQGVIDQLELLL